MSVKPLPRKKKLTKRQQEMLTPEYWDSQADHKDNLSEDLEGQCRILKAKADNHYDTKFGRSGFRADLLSKLHNEIVSHEKKAEQLGRESAKYRSKATKIREKQNKSGPESQPDIRL